MDTHDDLTQTVGDLAKTYLQCLQNYLQSRGKFRQ